MHQVRGGKWETWAHRAAKGRGGEKKGEMKGRGRARRGKWGEQGRGKVV